MPDGVSQRLADNGLGAKVSPPSFIGTQSPLSLPTVYDWFRDTWQLQESPAAPGVVQGFTQGHMRTEGARDMAIFH